jgi:hypothetical protein
MLKTCHIPRNIINQPDFWSVVKDILLCILQTIFLAMFEEANSSRAFIFPDLFPF